MALVGMSGARLEERERERVLEAIATESMAAIRSYLEGATLVCELVSNIAVAR
jgi:hypothetical protein